MNSIAYVVAALHEPSLCLQAANALRELCDANRTTLAPHIGAFAELHANLTKIPVCSFLFFGLGVVDEQKFRILRKAKFSNRLRVSFRPCLRKKKSLQSR